MPVWVPPCPHPRSTEALTPRPLGRAAPLHLPSWRHSASRNQLPRTGWCRGPNA